MTPQRRWIKRMIETAKADRSPMPWAYARANRKIRGKTRQIRATLPRKGV